MSPKNIILLNPTSGRGRTLKNREKLEGLLNKYNVDYKLIVTQSESHFRKLIHEYSKKAKSIITAGGDSSFTILINELITAGVKIPAGIIPLGSSDDIARELGILSVEDSVKSIAQGSVISADVGIISSSKNFRYYFAGQANLGIGVFVNRYVAHSRIEKGCFKKNQTISGVRAMGKAFKEKAVPQKFKIKSEEGVEEGEYTAIVLSKIKFWAGGKMFLPKAMLDDGKIHILKIGKSSFLKILKIIFKAKKGNHIDGAIVRCGVSNLFEIESNRDFQIQVDGDILRGSGKELAFRKIKVSVLKNKVKIIGPAL